MQWVAFMERVLPIDSLSLIIPSQLPWLSKLLGTGYPLVASSPFLTVTHGSMAICSSMFYNFGAEQQAEHTCYLGAEQQAEANVTTNMLVEEKGDYNGCNHRNYATGSGTAVGKVLRWR